MGTHSSWYHSPHPVQDTILPPSCVRHFVILPFTGLQGYKLCVRMLTTAGEETAREESARLQTLRENAENRRRRESSHDSLQGYKLCERMLRTAGEERASSRDRSARLYERIHVHGLLNIVLFICLIHHH